MKWESVNDRPVQPSPGFPNVVRYERCDYIPPQGRGRVSETLYSTSPPTFIEIQSPRTVSSDMYKVINRPPAEVEGIPNFSPVRTMWQDVPSYQSYPAYYYADQPSGLPPRETNEPPHGRRSYDHPPKQSDTPPKVYERKVKEYEPAYSPAFTEEVRRSEYVKSVGHPYNPGLMKSYVESYNQGYVHLNGYTQDDADRIFGKDMTPNPQFMVYNPHFKGQPVYQAYQPARLINRTVSSSTSDLRKRGTIKRHSILKPEVQPSSHSMRKRSDSPGLNTRNIFNLSTSDTSPQDTPMASRPHSAMNHKELASPSKADRESQTNTSFLLKNFLKKEHREREKEREELISPHRKHITVNNVSVVDNDRKKKKHFLKKAVVNEGSSTVVFDLRKQRTEEAKLVKQSLKDQETETNQLETLAKGIQTSATNLAKQFKSRSTSAGPKQIYNERGISPAVHTQETKDDDTSEEEDKIKKSPTEGAKPSLSLVSLVVQPNFQEPEDKKASKANKNGKRSKTGFKRKCSSESIKDDKYQKKSSFAKGEGSKNSPSFNEHKTTKTILTDKNRKQYWKKNSDDEIQENTPNEKEAEQTENEKPQKDKRKRKTSFDEYTSPCRERAASGSASPKERHMSIAAQKLSTKPKTYDKRSMYRCGTLRPEPETPHNWQCYMMHKQDLDEDVPWEKPAAFPDPAEIPAGVENELRHLKSQLFHLRKEWAHFSGNQAVVQPKVQGRMKPIQIDPAEDWIVT